MVKRWRERNLLVGPYVPARAALEFEERRATGLVVRAIDALAAEALDTAERTQPTVILQDLVMPDADGLDLITVYREFASTRHTPMIVLSAEENPRTKAEAFRRGANDDLVKPPERIELLARIRYHDRDFRLMLRAETLHNAEKQLLRAQRQAGRPCLAAMDRRRESSGRGACFRGCNAVTAHASLIASRLAIDPPPTHPRLTPVSPSGGLRDAISAKREGAFLRR